MASHSKMERKLPKTQDREDPILCDFACFGGDFSLQMALQMREFIVEPCCGYLKHSPDSGEYVSKKIMVIRHVEMKISKETAQMGQKKCSKIHFGRSRNF